MPSEDTLFLIHNKGLLEDQYSGRYVAISDQKVVAAGHTAAEVYRIVHELNIRHPLVVYIPKEGEEALLI